MRVFAKRPARGGEAGRERGAFPPPRGFARPARLRCAGKPLVQRQLLSVESLGGQLQDESGQRKELQTILKALDIYNGIEPEKAESFQERLKALKALDRAIYTWFDLHKAAEMDKVPNAARLKSFLEETEEEHADLIEQIADSRQLPVNVEGMQGKDIGRLEELWSSLLAGSGNIEIRENEKGVKRRVLSGLAKLLEEEHGRALVEDLNQKRGKGQEIVISSSFASELKGTTRSEKKESEAIPISSLDSETENAHKPVGISAQHGESKTPEYEPAGEDFSAPDFHDFLVENGQEELFRWGGDTTRRGSATGSLVRVLPESGYVLGEDDAQILMPYFVTLGHELGHAQRLLRGAALHDESFEKMGVSKKLEQTLWNNPEEYVNIKAVENRIRAEHGLSTRKYHAGDPYTLKSERAFHAFEEELVSLHENLSPYRQTLYDYSELGEKLQSYLTDKPDFGDDRTVEGILEELGELREEVKSESTQWVRALQSVSGEPKRQKLLAWAVRPFFPEASDAVILAAARATDCWTVLKEIMRAGRQIPFFEAGLTTEEFEQKVDPNLEVDVEIEFDQVDPGAPWWRRVRQIVYVRKSFREKRD